MLSITDDVVISARQKTDRIKRYPKEVSLIWLKINYTKTEDMEISKLPKRQKTI